MLKSVILNFIKRNIDQYFIPEQSEAIIKKGRIIDTASYYNTAFY